LPLVFGSLHGSQRYHEVDSAFAGGATLEEAGKKFGLKRP
jgi:hypothetical protein